MTKTTYMTCRRVESNGRDSFCFCADCVAKYGPPGPDPVAMAAPGAFVEHPELGVMYAYRDEEAAE